MSCEIFCDLICDCHRNNRQNWLFSVDWVAVVIYVRFHSVSLSHCFFFSLSTLSKGDFDELSNFNEKINSRIERWETIEVFFLFAMQRRIQSKMSCSVDSFVEWEKLKINNKVIGTNERSDGCVKGTHTSVKVKCDCNKYFKCTFNNNFFVILLFLQFFFRSVAVACLVVYTRSRYTAINGLFCLAVAG